LTTYFCWPNKFSIPLPTSVGPTNHSTYFSFRLFPLDVLGSARCRCLQSFSPPASAPPPPPGLPRRRGLPCAAFPGGVGPPARPSLARVISGQAPSQALASLVGRRAAAVPGFPGRRAAMAPRRRTQTPGTSGFPSARYGDPPASNRERGHGSRRPSSEGCLLPTPLLGLSQVACSFPTTALMAEFIDGNRGRG
jgi:hypothetical protein